ncbi:hypothetical protein Tco_0981260 [Tanacetum coccineum]
MSKVLDTEDMIKFMLDTQQFTYNVDMFCDTLKLPVETPENPFVAPANIHTIEAIMNRVGYQGVKNESIQYPRFIKLIIVDLMKKFPNIPKRLEEDYHSIKDDVPLVSVYTMGNVLVRGMLILDALLTAEIRETNDFKEYETVFIKQTVKKDDNDSEDRIDPGSHKDNPEVVDDDDDKEREKHDDEMGSLEIRNEETQTTIPTPLINTIIKDRDAFHSEVPAFVSQEFKTHAPKIITKLFEDFVQSNVIHVHPTTSLSNPTDSSADLQYQLYLKMNRSLQDRADNITLWEALRRKFKKSSTSNTSYREDDFHSHHDEHQDDDAPLEGKKDQHQEWDAWEEEKVVDEDEVISEDVTPGLVAESQNVDKRVPPIFDHARMEATLRDPLSNLSRNTEEYAYHLEQSTSFMENQIYGNTKEKKYILSLYKIHAEEFPEPNLEEKLNRWDVQALRLYDLRHGKEMCHYFNTIIKDRDAFHSEVPAFVSQEFKTHAPKIITKLFEDFVQSNVIHVHPTTSLSNPTDSSADLQYQLYLKMNRSLQDQSENFTLGVALRRKKKKVLMGEWAVEDEVIFYGNTKEKKYILSLYKIHAEEFPEPNLEEKASNKPDSFFEADFKYLNKNDIEDLYYLCRSKEIDNRKVKLMNSLITFIRSCVIWERVHDFQLGIESYQMKVNLTAPTLTFLGIEEHAPYTIVDEPRMGLIYLNIKDEKRVMYLEEIVKFCDATLEKVLNEVKLIMFESKFLKKPLLQGELDQDIMKAYEREISKRLSHR